MVSIVSSASSFVLFLTLNVTEAHICAIKLLFHFHVQSTLQSFSIVFERVDTKYYHNVPSCPILWIKKQADRLSFAQGHVAINICPAHPGSKVFSFHHAVVVSTIPGSFSYSFFHAFGWARHYPSRVMWYHK